MKNSENNPRVFLTDYASYNNGTQFEFGHWVDLTDFSDSDDFMEYVRNHFEEADEKSPLFSPREEIMITDFENFPKDLYCECGSTFEDIFEYLDLDDDKKLAIEFLLWNETSLKITDAIDRAENVYLYEDTNEQIWDLFETYYPDAAAAEENYDFVSINYDRFVNESFTRWTDSDGNSWIVDSY